MYKATKVLALVFGLAIFAVLSLPQSARADMITLDLTTSNLGSTYTGPFVTLTVTVPSGGGAATIGVKGDTSGGFTYNLDELGLNLSTASTASGLPSGWSQGGSKTLDGYGSFNTDLSTTGGFPASINSFSFTLTPTSGTFANASSVFAAGLDAAAAHVFATSSSCTGACATGFAGDAVVRTSTVPEPASLGLLGIGLIAMAFVARRKLAGAV